MHKSFIFAAILGSLIDSCSFSRGSEAFQRR